MGREEIILTITKELMLAMITSSATRPSSTDTGAVEKMGDNFKKLSQKVEEAYKELKK